MAVTTDSPAHGSSGQKDRKPRQAVQSLQRAFDLLELVAEAGGAVRLSELSATSGLPVPTVHRLVQTLNRLGYLRQDHTRAYSLGSRLIRLGNAAARHYAGPAQALLNDLRDASGETANLAVLEGTAVIYIAQAPSRHNVRMFTDVGRRVLPHCTGAGKVLLAQLPDDEVTEILSSTGMPSLTENTITGIGALQNELAIIRSRGYAIDDEEQELGVRCLAVAVSIEPSRLSISISGPTGRLNDSVIERTAPVMRTLASRLASTLGVDLPPRC